MKLDAVAHLQILTHKHYTSLLVLFPDLTAKWKSLVAWIRQASSAFTNLWLGSIHNCMLLRLVETAWLVHACSYKISSFSGMHLVSNIQVTQSSICEPIQSVIKLLSAFYMATTLVRSYNTCKTTEIMEQHV